ncbi:MAG: GEVED domain-containing protein [Caldilineaceae bacterium]
MSPLWWSHTAGADAILYGFIDWNGDGDFSDANETVTTTVTSGTQGDVGLSFSVPNDANSTQ